MGEGLWWGVGTFLWENFATTIELAKRS
jgi:hypothetical protein